ncbi:MAG: HAD-IA family hydrolase [Rhizomicrobium sp.]
MTPALIIDLDGTLVDTAPDLLGALNRTLVREGRRTVDHGALRHLVGYGARVMIGEAFRMTGEAVDETRLTALVDTYIVDYGSHIADASRPYPGVVETLKALKAEGARMGVLTNKPQVLTEILMPALGLDRYFSAIYGQGKMPYTKPDARIFHDVVREVGGVGAGALMIGDSVTDVQTARAAGAPVILVSYGYTPEPASMLGADAVVDRFADIPAAVRRLLNLP